MQCLYTIYYLTVPKFCTVFNFVVLITKQKVFYAVLIFTHMIEKCSLIKADNDEVSDEEEGDFVLKRRKCRRCQ